jgi:class 3 adenylate cyclase
MAVFGASRRALRWASELQHAVTLLSLRTGCEVVMRIGLHTGEAIQVGRDFLGVHVNYAARVASATPGGSVYVTALTAQIARGAPEFRFTNPQLVHLRGFDEPAELFELDWKHVIDANAAPAESAARDEAHPRS